MNLWLLFVNKTAAVTQYQKYLIQVLHGVISSGGDCHRSFIKEILLKRVSTNSKKESW